MTSTPPPVLPAEVLEHAREMAERILLYGDDLVHLVDHIARGVWPLAEVAATLRELALVVQRMVPPPAAPPPARSVGSGADHAVVAGEFPARDPHIRVGLLDAACAMGTCEHPAHHFAAPATPAADLPTARVVTPPGVSLAPPAPPLSLPPAGVIGEPVEPELSDGTCEVSDDAGTSPVRPGGVGITGMYDINVHGDLTRR